MALPKVLQPSLTPDELTFLAEEDVIDIVPLFSMTRVRLLSVSMRWVSDFIKLTGQGIYGPFQPPSACSVPIWLALSLKRKRKCRIVCPDWLAVGESFATFQHSSFPSTGAASGVEVVVDSLFFSLFVTFGLDDVSTLAVLVPFGLSDLAFPFGFSVSFAPSLPAA
jgi:hypothetical protein